jgi:hypothetical protein
MLGAVSIALNADREAVRAEALFEALHAVTELPDPTDSTDRDIGESIGLAKAQRAVQRLHTAAMKRIPAPPKEGTWLK